MSSAAIFVCHFQGYVWCEIGPILGLEGAAYVGDWKVNKTGYLTKFSQVVRIQNSQFLIYIHIFI